MSRVLASSSLPSTEEMTLRQALLTAGGPLKTARMSQGMIVRVDEQGVREEIHLDLGAILEGRQPDADVQPNDIIFVPGSTAKSVGYGVLGFMRGMALGRIIRR
jgi:protein involved in polysaccharide export with SLBB domain